MSDSSIGEVVEEFFWSINYYEQYGEKDDLLALIYLAYTVGYERGYTDGVGDGN